jgi:hypothetical protein
VAWLGYHFNLHAKLLPKGYLCELVLWAERMFTVPPAVTRAYLQS